MPKLSQKDWVIIASVATLATFIFLGNGNPFAGLMAALAGGQVFAQWSANLIGRGNKLSESTLVGGVVQEIPEVLQDQAEAVLGFRPDADLLALARMGRSEGVDGEEYRMHVAFNDLAYLNGIYGYGVYPNILSLMVHSKDIQANGHFSEQALGKRYSTARDPYESDYQLALKVFADRANGIDPTGGARKFVDKNSFGVQKGTGSYADTVAAWAAEGLTAVDHLPGASSNFVVFVDA